jgi:hypothetical protein
MHVPQKGMDEQFEVRLGGQRLSCRELLDGRPKGERPSACFLRDELCTTAAAEAASMPALYVEVAPRLFTFCL